MDPDFSYYDVLEITPQADDFEIKDAYRRLALKHHPDHNPVNRSVAELRFRLINEAYSELKTREKRLRYNQILKRQAGQAPQARNDNSSTGWFAQLAAFFTGSRNPDSRSGM